MCATYTTLPRSLHFELPGDAMDDVRYRGGFADVLRCECNGQDIAVKALRPQASSKEMRRVRQPLRASLSVRTGQLSIRFTEVLQGGHRLEISPTSERTTSDRGDHDRESIRHGVSVDDEW